MKRRIKNINNFSGWDIIQLAKSTHISVTYRNKTVDNILITFTSHTIANASQNLRYGSDSFI